MNHHAVSYKNLVSMTTHFSPLKIQRRLASGSVAEKIAYWAFARKSLLGLAVPRSAVYAAMMSLIISFNSIEMVASRKSVNGCRIKLIDNKGIVLEQQLICAQLHVAHALLLSLSLTLYFQTFLLPSASTTSTTQWVVVSELAIGWVWMMNAADSSVLMMRFKRTAHFPVDFVVMMTISSSLMST